MSWTDSVFLINSCDANNSKFGTGFLIFKDERTSYILTCQHVFDDVGGSSHAIVNNAIAELFCSGTNLGIDLCILKVDTVFKNDPIKLYNYSKRGDTFISAGFQKFSRDYIIRPIRGNLGDKVGLETRNRSKRISGWDLIVKGDFFLKPGYSGSPVIDEITNCALGVISHRHSDGEKGVAISVEAVKNLWTESQPEIFYRKTAESKLKKDWGDAPEVPIFFGRTEELFLLKKWIIEEQCKVVAIVGMAGIGKTNLTIKLGKGGIGKTDLALKFAYDIQDQFEYIVWRSLLNAPPITEILSDTIRFLSDQSEFILSENVNTQISRLQYYLNKKRCLLILDNYEAILKGGDQSGEYQEGYSEYGDLISKLSTTSHNSCLIITSREEPKEIEKHTSKTKPVRKLELKGLSFIDSQNIFYEIGDFYGSDDEWKELSDFYNGNPLALEMAAKHIKEVFFGDISLFLKEGKPIFYKIYDLLDWHYERLSDQEKEILFWIAINRIPISYIELKDDLLLSVSKDGLSNNLQKLQRRIPLEKIESRFTLQPVLLEFITEKFIKIISQSLINNAIPILNQFSILKAMTRDYVRNSQERKILKPIYEIFFDAEGNKENVEKCLKKCLDFLRISYQIKSGYAGGNILNILCYMNFIISNYNFSGITVWNGFLQKNYFYNVDFSDSDLSKSVFIQTFGTILAIDISSNKEFLATGDAIREVRLWRLSDGQPLLKCIGHENWIRSIKFSPTNKYVASCSEDKTIRFWDINRGNCLKILEGHNGCVESINFNPDGSFIASGSFDHTVRIWDANSGDVIKTLKGHKDYIYDVVFSHDGQYIASCSSDGSIKIWDVNSGDIIKTINGHSDIIVTISFNLNNKLIISGSYDHTIKIWDIENGQCLNTLKGHSNRIRSIDISPDGDKIVSGSYDNTLKIWSISNGNCLHTLKGHSNWVRSVVFSPDGETVISGGHDQTVKIWEVSSGQCLSTYQGCTNWILSLCFSPTDVLFATGSEDKILRFWRVDTDECIKSFQTKSRILTLAYNPDGKIIATGGEDHEIRLWDVKTGDLINTLKGHINGVRSVTFSLNNKYLASGSDDNTIKIWDLKTAQETKTFYGHSDRVWSVVFHNDKLIASCSSDKDIKIWDLKTFTCIKTLTGHTNWVLSVDFSPDGKRLVSGGIDNTIMLWDVQSGQCIWESKEHNNWIRSVKFNFDGNIIASGSEDKSIKLWEADTGKCLKTFKGHTSWIVAVDFSPSLPLLISGGGDETIRVWDIDKGKTIKILKPRRPYEKVNIKNTKGITDAQKMNLIALGAITDYH